MTMIISAFKTFIGYMVKLSTIGFKSGPHITRYYMNRHLEQVLHSVDTGGSGNRILAISGSRDLAGMLGIEQPEITEINFPEYDLLALPFSENSFDFVVCGQVLEHIKGDPQKAIDEARRVLKTGGIAVFTTCFLNPIHSSTPGDFWRFTPDALRLLLRDFSKIIDVGGWGNIYALFIIWIGLRFNPVPHAKWHPLHKIAVKNNTDYPIVTWIAAQK